MIIKRFNVLKLAIFQGALMAAFGLIAGLFVLLFGSMMGAMGGSGMPGMLGGVGAVIILPILYGVFGFVAGAIGAFIYNLVANVVGGIEIEVE